MENNVLNLMLMCYSAGLFGFGLVKQIWRLSRMVFGFYFAVFMLAWSYYFYYTGSMNSFEFSVIHISIFQITVFSLVYKFLNDFEKYYEPVIVIFCSIVLIISSYLWLDSWFNELHTLILLIDLSYVTWFVLSYKNRKIEGLI